MESISQAMNKLGIRALAYDKIKQKAKSKLLLLAFAEHKRGNLGVRTYFHSAKKYYASMNMCY